MYLSLWKNLQVSEIVDKIFEQLKKEVYQSLFVTVGKKYELFDDKILEATIKEIVNEYFDDTDDLLSIEETFEILAEEKHYLIDEIFCYSIQSDKIPNMIKMQDIQVSELLDAVSNLEKEISICRSELLCYFLKPFLWHKIGEAYSELQSIRKTLKLSSHVLEDLYQEMRFIHRTLSRITKI